MWPVECGALGIFQQKGIFLEAACRRRGDGGEVPAAGAHSLSCRRSAPWSLDLSLDLHPGTIHVSLLVLPALVVPMPSLSPENLFAVMECAGWGFWMIRADGHCGAAASRQCPIAVAGGGHSAA